MNMGFLRKASVPGMPGLRIRSRLSWIASRLRNRPASEPELTGNRLALSGTAFMYLIVSARFGRAESTGRGMPPQHSSTTTAAICRSSCSSTRMTRSRGEPSRC